MMKILLISYVLHGGFSFFFFNEHVTSTKCGEMNVKYQTPECISL